MGDLLVSESQRHKRFVGGVYWVVAQLSPEEEPEQHNQNLLFIMISTLCIKNNAINFLNIRTPQKICCNHSKI